MRTLCAVVVFFFVTLASAHAYTFPARLAATAPFPAIDTEAPTFWPLAPGVDYAEYALQTIDGPIEVRAVAIDPHAPGVRIEDALANDRLTSPGETVTSMAQRAHAVAGINGDFFAIGSTNEPLNVVVHDGTLLRGPMQRAAFALDRDGHASIGELSLSGTIAIGSTTMPLDAVDALPSSSNVIALIEPAFGDLPPSQTTLVALQPLDGSAPFGRYRVSGIADNATDAPAGYYLAIGSSALAKLGLPAAGDVVTIAGDLAPAPLASLTTAIGGGPVLLRDGVAVDDPDGPNGLEFTQRIPISGAGIALDGTVLLVEVDGRQPASSIGVTRAQFAALLASLGARDAMAFDGGGSSTLVARLPGDTDAVMQNLPSDGKQRRVANALLVMSDAPQGPPVTLAALPQAVRAIVGARVPVRIVALDAGDHTAADTDPVEVHVEPAGLASFEGGDVVALRAGNGVLNVQEGPLTARVPIIVDAQPARLRIEPATINAARDAHISFAARAYDRNGYPLALPEQLSWTATSGRIAPDGTYVAGAGDATVGLSVGTSQALASVSVGSHEAPFPFLRTAHLVSVPHDAPARSAQDTSCPDCVGLTYDFSNGARAAFLDNDAALTPDTVGIAMDVNGDANGEILRVAVQSAADERILLTAARIDFRGPRHVVVRFPATMPLPAHLRSVYLVNAIDGPPVRSAGRIVIGGLRAVVAGSAPTGAPPQGRQ